MVSNRTFEGGYRTYGAGLGIMMTDSTFPRPPGDVGNAQTFDYPVYYEPVEGASPVRVVRDQDPEVLDELVATAERLVEKGAVAITTSCGFFLQFQDELADRVDVPIYTSSLLQIPLVSTSIGTDERIGIISADERNLERLDHHVLTDYRDQLVYEGVSDSDAFQSVIIDMTTNELDLDLVGEDVEAAARRLTERDDIGAILFECTNLRPYVDRVQNATGLPVYDYLTMADFAWRAGVGTRY